MKFGNTLIFISLNPHNSHITVIADSSSTRTDWVLMEGEKILEHAYTQGLNPFFQTRRDISHIMRLELPPSFFKRRWRGVFFYGAGCSSAEKKKIMETSLISQFRTPTVVESDLLGAARGVMVREPGIVCILGTGSNSCIYNGLNIVSSVRSGGFILGDEGSGAALGRSFISDCLKNLAPKLIMDDFYAKFELNADSVMDKIYASSMPSSLLNTYSFILSEHLDNEYAVNLVKDNFRNFFRRHLLQYRELGTLNLGFVGAVACIYADLLRSVAQEFDVEISKIVSCSMPGLMEYHLEAE